MAVPKNKRYKQVVRSRRFDQKSKLIIKKNLIFSRFKNYFSNFSIFNKKINNKFLFKLTQSNLLFFLNFSKKNVYILNCSKNITCIPELIYCMLFYRKFINTLKSN